MFKFILLLCAVISLPWQVCGQASAKHSTHELHHRALHHGTISHDGINLHYEIHGVGPALLLVHGNGGSSEDFRQQVRYFSKKYRVITMDSRDHGRSGDGADPLTYEAMTSDLAYLLTRLDAGPAFIVGWSDGGIQALELGIHYPQLVRKIVAAAPNLTPDDLDPAITKIIQSSVSESSGNTPERAADIRKTRWAQLILTQPHIALSELDKIVAPTLIIAGDHDVISEQATIAIYHHLSQGELSILPGTTHAFPFEDAVGFDTTVDRFLSRPFIELDPIHSLFDTLSRLRNQNGGAIRQTKESPDAGTTSLPR